MKHDIAIGIRDFWRRMSFMASLSLAAGLSPRLYIAQLIECAATPAPGKGES